VGITSSIYNIHFIAKKMGEYEWDLNTLPKGLHICMTERLLNIENPVESFINDLKKSIEYINNHKDEDPGEAAQIYCSTQKIPDYAEDVLEEIGRAYIDVQDMVNYCK